jgi:hypothetical protein
MPKQRVAIASSFSFPTLKKRKGLAMISSAVVFLLLVVVLSPSKGLCPLQTAEVAIEEAVEKVLPKDFARDVDISKC